MAAGQSVELLGADPAHFDAYRHELILGGHSGRLDLIPFSDPRSIASNGTLFTPDPALALVSLALASWSGSFFYCRSDPYSCYHGCDRSSRRARLRPPWPLGCTDL